MLRFLSERSERAVKLLRLNRPVERKACPMNSFIFRFTKIVAKIALRPFFQIQATGLTNIPEKGSFILLPKHQRWEDIPLLGITIQRPLYYIAKTELFKNPISRWFITSLGGISLKREQPIKSRESFRLMMKLLQEGEGLVLFPEGTYYRDRVGAGHAGMMKMILSRFTIPCIPVGIRYSKKGWRTEVRIAMGNPVHGDSLKNVHEIIEHIMRDIAKLSGFSDSRTGL